MQGIDMAAKRELKKIFQVAVSPQCEGNVVCMPSCYVDTVWHKLLKDKKAYRRFCLGAVGVVVAHLPNKGEGVLDWVPIYEARFGRLPPVWFTNPAGDLNASVHMAYLMIGTVRTSWDCTPLKCETGKTVALSA